MRSYPNLFGPFVCLLIITLLAASGCGGNAPPPVGEDEDVVFVYRRDMNKPITSLNAPSKVEHTLTDEQAKQFIALVNSPPTMTGEKAKNMYMAIFHLNHFKVAGRTYTLTSSSVFYRDDDKNTFAWSHPLLKTMTDLKDPDTIEASLAGMAGHDWPVK